MFDGFQASCIMPRRFHYYYANIRLRMIRDKKYNFRRKKKTIIEFIDKYLLKWFLTLSFIDVNYWMRSGMIFTRKRLERADGRFLRDQNVSATKLEREKFRESKSIGREEKTAESAVGSAISTENSATIRPMGGSWERIGGRERDTSKDVPIQMSWTFKIFRMLNSPVPAFPFRSPVPSRTKRAGRSPSVTRTKFRISSLFILPHYRPSAFLLLSFLKQLMAHYVPQFIFHRSHAECFSATSPY